MFGFKRRKLLRDERRREVHKLLARVTLLEDAAANHWATILALQEAGSFKPFEVRFSSHWDNNSDLKKQGYRLEKVFGKEHPSREIWVKHE